MGQGIVDERHARSSSGYGETEDAGENVERPSTRPRLRPVIYPPAPRPEPSKPAEQTPSRPVIRSAEGLRQVFRLQPTRSGEEPSGSAARAAPQRSDPEPRAGKPSRRLATRPRPTPAEATDTGEPTTLGGVRTAALEPKGGHIQPQATARRTVQWIASKILTIVEVLTVSALVIVVILVIADWMMSNEEAAAEQRLLLTPAASSLAEAQRRRAVLPGSSQPPPGEDEIPPQFRPYLVASTPLPLPTPGPRQATRIVIKKIGVDAPVLEGDDWHTLKKGAGHTPGTANPGEAGNCVFSGHDDVYGEVFRYLSELKPGDPVLVYTSDGHGFKYVVKTSFLVLPDEVEVLDPTPDPILTLITCYPYLIDSHRLIVVCTLEGDAPSG